MTQTEISIPARSYQDADNCLSVAQDDARQALDLAGWDLAPRWGDDDRETISLTVPAHAAQQAKEWARSLRR